MENVSEIIKRHNKRVIKTNKRPITQCNCRDKSECTINGDCRVKNVEYEHAVSTTEMSKKLFKLVLLLSFLWELNK